MKITQLMGQRRLRYPYGNKMQKDTTPQTGWINYVHQHEKMPSKKRDSKWRARNANSTISNLTHFDPAHHESHADSQKNASIVMEKNKDEQQNPKLVFEWVNNKSDPRTDGLYPAGC